MEYGHKIRRKAEKNEKLVEEGKDPERSAEQFRQSQNDELIKVKQRRLERESQKRQLQEEKDRLSRNKVRDLDFVLSIYRLSMFKLLFTLKILSDRFMFHFKLKIVLMILKRFFRMGRVLQIQTNKKRHFSLSN